MGVNKREVVFNSDGTLFKVISWYIQSGGEKTVSSEYPLYKYWGVQGYTPEGNIWIKINNYLLKSPTGELLKTTTERPLELGEVKITRQPDRSYILSVQYPDKAYTVIVPRQRPDEIIRDTAGNFYVIQRLVDALNAGTPEEETIQHYRIIRFNCKETDRLDLPEDEYEVIGRDIVVGVKERVLAEYGQPVIAPNGDVYTWKRTPDTYSILKWTWQDDSNPPADIPDAPINLTISPSTTALNLTWKPPLQDPGCVTGYELDRSSISGGSYSAIGTVSNSVFSYSDTLAVVGSTYYYRVRAVGGDGYSEYSSTVSGQR